MPTWCVRRLEPHDLPSVERHLLALDATDRSLRFGLALGDVAVSAYVRQLDLRNGMVFGVMDGADGELLGIAEVQPAPVAGRVEMAVSVHRDHRCQGLGRLLVRAALAAAFGRGAKSAEFLFAPGNRSIAGLMRALSARIDATMDRAVMQADQMVEERHAA